MTIVTKTSTALEFLLMREHFWTKRVQALRLLLKPVWLEALLDRNAILFEVAMLSEMVGAA